MHTSERYSLFLMIYTINFTYNYYTYTVIYTTIQLYRSIYEKYSFDSEKLLLFSYHGIPSN